MERMLTVLVPIREGDYTLWTGLVPPTVADFPDENTIYLYNGLYYRKYRNERTGEVSVINPVDREFPYIGKPLEIFDFTYDATRMGSAPTISIQNIKWFAEKDADGNDVTLEDLWTQDCHVVFNDENFYLKQIPTSSKNHEDARYTYDLDFVSERAVLETVYLYDVVLPFISERPTSQDATFRLYCGIEDMLKRFNASLLSSGLASLVYLSGVTPSVFLTYEEFNAVGVGTYAGQKDTSDPYPEVPGYHDVHSNIYEHFGGNYTLYLMNRVYQVNNPVVVHIGPAGGGYDEIRDGEYVMKGYQCVLGKDKYGNTTTSKQALLEFENNTIHDGLQEVNEKLELQYYITKERDVNGVFTGNTLIMFADCEHDFADMNAAGTDFVRDDDGIPTTEHPFDYGVDNELLSKTKTNTTDKIITRNTGVGSDENIPWYYPNPTADGWLKPVYKRSGEVQDITVDYPLDEGSTVADNVAYEKYLKNRIGHVFNYGVTKQLRQSWDYSYHGNESLLNYFKYGYNISAKNITYPKLQIRLKTTDDSQTTRLVAYLFDMTINSEVDSYDSSETYADPTPFQNAMASADASVAVDLTPEHTYYVELNFYFQNTGKPLSKNYDYSGRYYPAVNVTRTGYTYPAHVPDGFYNEENLIATGKWGSLTSSMAVWGGYSVDGTYENRRTPKVRMIGKQYKDINTGTIYKCTQKEIIQSTYSIGSRQTGFTANPTMEHLEWADKCLSLSLIVKEADGWYLNSKKVELEDYSLTLPDGTVSYVFDTIEFQRVKYITPQPRLMPELYIKTDGERRFYDAIQYPRGLADIDPAAGERIATVSGSIRIVNPLYKPDETQDSHYVFENILMPNFPKENIAEYDDIKPSIEGIKRAMTIEGATRQYRIDVVEEFEYDLYDNNEIWESNDDGNISGEYKHPYFFAKLRPLGFNLFDLALQDDMVLSMTTGHCGACSFKIGVDENTKKNPVQIWEFDVYSGSDFATAELRYSAGSLRRYVDTTELYYDTDGTEEGYIQVDRYTGIVVTPGFLVDTSVRQVASFERTNYTALQITSGEVGSLKQEPKRHFEGDVKTSGKFIESQQDTSENFVWVALYKDTDTYGEVMPSAQPDYGDNNLSRYIDPKGHVYHDRKYGTETRYSDDDADNFVLLNIRMPQTYLRAAEHKLSRKIVEDMYDNNYQKFNFGIGFSRIFLAQNKEVCNNLNENSVLYIGFNNRVYRQYVQHYTYKMSHEEVLPEISVDMNEELSVTRTLRERNASQERRNRFRISHSINNAIQTYSGTIQRRFVDRNDDTIVNGNLVSRDSVSSINEMNTGMRRQSVQLEDTQVDLEVNHFRCEDFQIVNGTDLKIGDELGLPTAYRSGMSMLRRQFDIATGTFVTDASADFKPAFIAQGAGETRYKMLDAAGKTLAPARISGHRIVQDIDNNNDEEKNFVPAFIDKANNRLVEYKANDTVDNNKIIKPALKSDVDTFNVTAIDIINQIKYTMEKRVLPDLKNAEIDEQCPERYVLDDESGKNYFWLDKNGDGQEVPQECSTSNGLMDITWVVG